MTSSIIARAEEFFYFEDDLTQSIEAWASSRCESFGKKEDEHPLEHQQMFFEYQGEIDVLVRRLCASFVLSLLYAH